MAAVAQVGKKPPAAPAAAAATQDALAPGARRCTASPRQMLAAVVAGCAVLALFASSGLPSWSEDLGQGLLTASLRQAAGAWSDGMEQLGLTAPQRALHAALQRLRDAVWR